MAHRWLVVCLLLVGCGGDAAEPGPSVCDGVRWLAPPPVSEQLAGLTDLGFDAFVEASFEALLRRDPESVSELGLHTRLGMDHSQLTDVSAAYEAETRRLTEGILTRLRAFDPSTLGPEQQRTVDIYGWYLEDELRQHAFALERYPVTHFITSPHNGLELLLSDLHPLAGRQDAEDYINRLCQVGAKIDQLIAKLDERAAAGLTAPAPVLEWASWGIGDLAESQSGAGTELYRTFADRVRAVDALSPDDIKEFIERAEVAIETSVIPAYTRLAQRVDALRGDAPGDVGLGQYPRGAEHYAMLLRHFTTTTLSASEIHQLGLSEIARIHDEMRAHFEALGYPADESLRRSFDRVAEDGGVVPASAVVDTYEAIITDAESRLPEAFERVPTAPWDVIGVTYGGYYIAPPLDGSRPGAFYASADSDRPRYSMASLAYHELIPGHHFQLALARESGLPLPRKLLSRSGFTEGWALYAERLAADLGWYADDPYSDLGRLQMEAFRAARLVVDTGLHAMGWTFERAASYLRDNTGFPPEVISAEGQIARYVAWPAQATAYMVGMLELLRLREHAQRQLADAFELPRFHSAVLEHGSVPLEVLQGLVDVDIADGP